ncbi:hypothetical protein GCM10009678_03270 [Actinomadura kijaniata]|uniref:Uncharacterized protein n=1 Tax=Actinomadura namibiensis TaxID=182080 RepID=A0A7W3QP05_ACTNM|nr:hypothetical protein [Actinomadura namibiensis]MBA8954101.1 hypothetical protein [Actinomadura namibiensis]
MKRLTPQEKKRLSYQRDRRNWYGENDKSSRKNIPRNRALKHRAARHRVAQELTVVRGGLDEDRLERRLNRRPAVLWRKYRDAPLGEVVEWQLNRRVERSNAAPEQAEARARRIRQRRR